MKRCTKIETLFYSLYSGPVPAPMADPIVVYPENKNVDVVEVEPIDLVEPIDPQLIVPSVSVVEVAQENPIPTVSNMYVGLDPVQNQIQDVNTYYSNSGISPRYEHETTLDPASKQKLFLSPFPQAPLSLAPDPVENSTHEERHKSPEPASSPTPKKITKRIFLTLLDDSDDSDDEMAMRTYYAFDIPSEYRIVSISKFYNDDDKEQDQYSSLRLNKVQTISRLLLLVYSTHQDRSSLVVGFTLLCTAFDEGNLVLFFPATHSVRCVGCF